MPELLKQYQGDPIRLGLLSLTDNEKRSVMERTLPYDSSTPNDKEFIKIVINTARLALRDKYLRRSYHRYGQEYSTARIQYDYTRDNAKITIPESIGYIKLLIDNFSIPPGEKKELLVTLMEQNPELVKGKLPIVKKELGNSDIFDNEKFDRAELHKLLDNIDSDKVGNLFKEISGLDIEKVWREQKEFVLLKQIYIAATTYGESNSACTQGIWSQVISSLDEIDSKLMDQYEQYLDEKREQERQKDTISRGNIAQFTEDLARKLIQYAANNPEIKEALEDFALAMVNVEEPQKITLKQQKIIAKINQEFSENIKKFLPNYSKDIPTGDEYQIIIGELLKIKIMQDFAKAQAEMQEVNDERNQSTLLSNVDVSQGASRDYYI